MASLLQLKKEVRHLADSKRAKILQRFFKTGKGEYGEGDIFLGLTVPQARKIAMQFKHLSMGDVTKLLESKIHEERLIALFILVDRFNRANEQEKELIYTYYLKNTQYINNWDLVDLSAYKIVGAYLIHNDRSVLAHLAKSDSTWERRIAIIATYQFIKSGNYKDTLRIAEILLHDKHDLIQKAVGWMLREVGKRCSQEVLEAFLKKYYREMNRTTLRYAIEHFPEKVRKAYLASEIGEQSPKAQIL